MNYRDRNTSNAIHKLQTTGIVPLDQIFDLCASGISYRKLDNKFDVTNKPLRKDELHVSI